MSPEIKQLLDSQHDDQYGYNYQRYTITDTKAVGPLDSKTRNKLRGLLNAGWLPEVRTVDIGCNLGFFVFYAWSWGGSCTGVDTDARRLDYCRKMRGRLLAARCWNHHSLPGFTDSLDGAGAGFDQVLLLSVYHHMWRSNRDHVWHANRIRELCHGADKAELFMEMPVPGDKTYDKIFPKHELCIDTMIAAFADAFGGFRAYGDVCYTPTRPLFCFGERWKDRPAKGAENA